MTMFREFFTFELKFRFKASPPTFTSPSGFAFSFPRHRRRSFGPIGSSNGKVLLTVPMPTSITTSVSAFRHHCHRRDLWHFHSARFSARHCADPIH